MEVPFLTKIILGECKNQWSGASVSIEDGIEATKRHLWRKKLADETLATIDSQYLDVEFGEARVL